ncbi:hypothetical protein CC2G_006023 [Coprinopsis cinerea AmutBmut pab1-1]|nr:hypothetical protein CC2G_006023 [Coprinopsis cinerea AmutBmut pab1-1]
MLPSRIPILLLSLSLSFLPKALGLKGGSDCSSRLPYSHFCVNATIENEVVTYELTNMLDAESDVGWMAIGFGRTMLQSPMAILWKNPDGTMTVSQRVAVWFMEPFVERAPDRIATPVEPKRHAWHPAKSTTFAFQVPVNRTKLAASPIEDLVWAYSPSRPSTNGPHARLARHTEVGYLKLDLSTDLSAPSTHSNSNSTKSGSSSSNHGKTILAHAFLLTFGFLLVLPIGVLTGRWARTFTPVWFKVHWILNWPVALPMIALGWCLGPIAVNQHDGTHFSDPHKQWGTVLVSIYLVQIILGRHIHQKRAEQAPPIKKNHPPLNILHVVIGLVILLGAFLQVKTGLDKLKYSPDYYNVARVGEKIWNFWAVAVPFIYIVGLYFLPKQFGQERANSGAAAPQEGGYMSLDDSSANDDVEVRRPLTLNQG